MTIKKVSHFASWVQIAHHIPGRIRLRLALAEDAAIFDEQEQSLLTQARNFREVLDSIPGICSIKVNLMARSCTVEYDRNLIPFQAWHDFFAGVGSAEAGILTRIIEEKYAEVACA